MTDIPIKPPARQTQRFLHSRNKTYPDLINELMGEMLGKHRAPYNNSREWFDTLEETLIKEFPDIAPHQFDAAIWATISTHGNRIPATEKEERISETLEVMDTAIEELAEHADNTESPHANNDDESKETPSETDNAQQTLEDLLKKADAPVDLDDRAEFDEPDDEDDDPDSPMFA